MLSKLQQMQLNSKQIAQSASNTTRSNKTLHDGNRNNVDEFNQ